MVKSFILLFEKLVESSVFSKRLLNYFSRVLFLSRGTAVQKSFLVPFFALQAPTSIISWIK